MKKTVFLGVVFLVVVFLVVIFFVVIFLCFVFCLIIMRQKSSFCTIQNSGDDKNQVTLTPKKHLKLHAKNSLLEENTLILQFLEEVSIPHPFRQTQGHHNL